jgi:hypothetical protein
MAQKPDQNWMGVGSLHNQRAYKLNCLGSKDRSNSQKFKMINTIMHFEIIYLKITVKNYALFF